MKNRLKALFTKDLPRKFLAIFLAALIWYAIEEQLRDITTLHNVPVKLLYDRSQLMIMDSSALTVDVVLRGTHRALSRVASGDIVLEAAMPSDIPVGIYFYDLPITEDNVVKLPPGIAVDTIRPSQAQIQVDRIVSKHNVPIRVRFAGSLREGYRKNRVAVTPPAVDVRGPSKVVDDLKEILTDRIVLDDTVGLDFEMEVDLIDVPRVNFPETAHVVVEITKYAAQQAYHDLPLNVLSPANCPLRLAEPLPNVSVTLHGPKLILESLDYLSIRSFVDISRIAAPGRYRRPVNAWVEGAAGLKAEYVNPSVVDVVLVDPKKADGDSPQDRDAVEPPASPETENKEE